jgi:hypothetical protein
MVIFHSFLYVYRRVSLYLATFPIQISGMMGAAILGIKQHATPVLTHTHVGRIQRYRKITHCYLVAKSCHRQALNFPPVCCLPPAYLNTCILMFLVVYPRNQKWVIATITTALIMLTLHVLRVRTHLLAPTRPGIF